jgi:TadE-like protein
MKTKKISELSRRLMGNPQHDERGAAVVEGALVFGIFVMLIFGLMEFGLFFMFWSTGRNGTSEVAHEVAVAGRSNLADYSGLMSVRSQARTLKGRLRYIVVFRADSIKAPIPPECLAEAESKITDGSAATTPHGYFFGEASGDTVETFNWDQKRPKVACNIYYPKNIELLPTGKNSFIYERPCATNCPAIAVLPSLDKFWPGGLRTDWINGPVDYVGVYTSTQYTSVTGIISSRKVTHLSKIQIEPRRTL